MIVSTTVVVIVCMTLHVTNRLVTVIQDVTLDISMMTVRKSVNSDIMEWIAANVVADSVKTMRHVTMSVEYAQAVVRTGILESIVITLAREDILAQTVPRNVHPTVSTPVYTRKDRVLVQQVIRVTIVPQSAYSLTENNASTHAVLTASTRHVTESTVVVCMAVKREKNVMKLKITLKQHLHQTIYL